MNNSTQQTPSGAPDPHSPSLPVNGNQYPFSHDIYNQSPPISSTTIPSRPPQVSQSPGHHTFNMGTVPQYMPPANKNPPLDHHVPLQDGPGVPAHQAVAPNWNAPARPQTSHTVTNSNLSTQYVPTNITPAVRQTPGHVSNTNSSNQYMSATPSPGTHPGMYTASPGPQFMPRPAQLTPQPTPTPGSVPPGIQRPRQPSASNAQGFAQNYGPIINGHLVPPSLRASGFTAAGPSPQVPGHAFTSGGHSPQFTSPGNGNCAPRPASAVPRRLTTRFNLPSNAQVAPRAVQSTIGTPDAAVNNNLRQSSSIPPTGIPPTIIPPTSMSSTGVPPTDTPPSSATPTSAPPAGTPPSSATPASTHSAGTPSTSAPPAGLPSLSAPPAGLPSLSAPPTVMSLDRMDGSDSLQTIDQLGIGPSTSAPLTGAPPRPSMQTPSAANQTTIGTTPKHAANQNLPQQPAKRQRKKAAHASTTHQPPVTSTQRAVYASVSAPGSASAFQKPPPVTNVEPMHLPDYELNKINSCIMIEPDVGKPRPKGKNFLAWEEAIGYIDELVEKYCKPGQLCRQLWHLHELCDAVEEFIARPGRRPLAPGEAADLLNVRYIRVVEDGIYDSMFGYLPQRDHGTYKATTQWFKKRLVKLVWDKKARERMDHPQKWDWSDVRAEIQKWGVPIFPSLPREEPQDEEESEAPGQWRSLDTHKPKPWWQEPPK